MLLPSGRYLGREEVTFPSTSEFPSGELSSPKFGAPLSSLHNQSTLNLCFVWSSSSVLICQSLRPQGAETVILETLRPADRHQNSTERFVLAHSALTFPLFHLEFLPWVQESYPVTSMGPKTGGGCKNPTIFNGLVKETVPQQKQWQWEFMRFLWLKVKLSSVPNNRRLNKLSWKCCCAEGQRDFLERTKEESTSVSVYRRYISACFSMGR